MNAKGASAPTPVVPAPGLAARLLRFAGLYLLAPLLLLLEIPVVLQVAHKPETGMRVHDLVVRSVDPDGPAARAGLRVGDRLLGVDGQLLATSVDYYAATAGLGGPEPHQYLVRRGSELINATIQPEPPRRSWIIWSYGLSLAGLAFLAMGWLILSRRTDMVARYFFGLCMTFAFFLMDVPNWPNETYMTLKEIARDLATLLLPVIFLRFSLYFPDRVHLTRRSLHRHRWLMLPAAPLFLLSLYAQAARLDPSTSTTIAIAQQLTAIYFAVYMVAGLVVFIRKILERDRPLRHAKMRLALTGMVAGFVPFVVGAVLHNVGAETALPYQDWYGFSLALVPLCFGVAILRYGALDLEYVVRHALAYTLLTAVVVVSYILLVGLLGGWLAARFRGAELPVVVLTVVGLTLVLNPLRRRLLSWLERVFYPSRRATREAVQKLAHDLAGLTGDPGATGAMLRRLHDLYRPGHVALFLAAGDTQRLQAIHADAGTGGPTIDRLPADSTLCRVLLTAHRPVYVEEIEGLDTAEANDPATDALIADLGAALFVPLIFGRELRGLVSMGPKRGGALYSQADLANLHALSLQAAALVEIARTHRENLERKRMETELSVARRIQSNLVPRETLRVPGLHVAGRMDSCGEVGGDYFDFFPLEGGGVGFAIADVAGKGVPAALVMTSLRVAFRSAAASRRDPERVVESLNETLCALGDAALLVSFFYGVVDAGASRLSYSNAGMNPPLLYRTDAAWTERLRKGGTMLGINPGQRYARGTISLNAGDLLMLYTDGFTEQPDRPEGVFYGEARLSEVAARHRDRPLDDLLGRIFADVESWGGPRQSDDRTLMLLRVNSMAAESVAGHSSG